MPDSPKPAHEPTSTELLEEGRSAERSATAVELAAGAARKDTAEPGDEADKTDMGAVGDDGQVFGG